MNKLIFFTLSVYQKNRSAFIDFVNSNALLIISILLVAVLVFVVYWKKYLKTELKNSQVSSSSNKNLQTELKNRNTIKRKSKEDKLIEYKNALELMLKTLQPVQSRMDIIKMRAKNQIYMLKEAKLLGDQAQIGKMDDYKYWGAVYLKEYVLASQKYKKTDVSGKSELVEFDWRGSSLTLGDFNLEVMKDENMFKGIIIEYEKFIKKAIDLKLNVTKDFHNDYCVANASLLAVEMFREKNEKEVKESKKEITSKELKNPLKESAGNITIDFNGTKIETTLKKFDDSKIGDLTGFEVNENGEYEIYPPNGYYKEIKECFEIITNEKYVLKAPFSGELHYPVNYGRYHCLIVAFVNCKCPDIYSKDLFNDETEPKFFFTQKGSGNDAKLELMKGDSKEFKVLSSNTEYFFDDNYYYFYEVGLTIEKFDNWKRNFRSEFIHK